MAWNEVSKLRRFEWIGVGVPLWIWWRNKAQAYSSFNCNLKHITKYNTDYKEHTQIVNFKLLMISLIFKNFN